MSIGDVLNGIQTVGIVGGLAITGWQLFRETRERKFQNYLDHMSLFLDSTKQLVENPVLHPLYCYSEVNIKQHSYDTLDADVRSRVHYCDTLIALCETVWMAARQGWIAETEWRYIRTWLRQLGQSPDFRWTVDWVRDDYEDEFMKEVRAEVGAGLKELAGRKPAADAESAR